MYLYSNSFKNIEHLLCVTCWHRLFQIPMTQNSQDKQPGFFAKREEVRDQKQNRVCMLSRSVVFDSLRPYAIALQAPLSIGFPRQEHWRGLHFLLQGNILTQVLNPFLLHLLHWQEDSAGRPFSNHKGGKRLHRLIHTKVTWQPNEHMNILTYFNSNSSRKKKNVWELGK